MGKNCSVGGAQLRQRGAEKGKQGVYLPHAMFMEKKRTEDGFLEKGDGEQGTDIFS